MEGAYLKLHSRKIALVGISNKTKNLTFLHAPL